MKPGWLAPVLAFALSPAALAVEPEPWRSTPPAPGIAKVMVAPKAQTFRIGRLDVLLVERHELPVVTLELELTGGSAWDPPGHEGQASVCMTVLTAGTQELDKQQLAETEADLAASFSTWVGVERQALQLAVLSDNFQPALDLFAELLLRPGLRSSTIRNVIAARQIDLVRQRRDPKAIAHRVASRVAFGPVGPGRLPTEASLQTIDVAACRQYVARLSPRGAHLYVVGDIRQEDLVAAWQQRFAAWNRPATPLPRAQVPQPLPGRLFAVDLPGAEQTVVQILHAGPARDAHDYEATALMMGVLAGNFSSRINLNLREGHGWSYFAGGGFQYRPAGSLLYLSAAVRPDVSAAAIVEMFREMARIRDAPPDLAELQREQQGALLALPALWATGSSTAETFQELHALGLPLDWYDGHVSRLLAVDVAALQRAAQDHVQPTQAQVVVVGDLAKIGQQLQTLMAQGPVLGVPWLRLDADGRLVPELR